MSGTDTQPDDNDGEEFDLAEFIDDKSSLFAVMGVFVAVAAYLSRAQPGPITDFEVSFRQHVRRPAHGFRRPLVDLKPAHQPLVLEDYTCFRRTSAPA